MSKMIIKDRISQLRKGYPTMSDKYDVMGGILESTSADVKFGELVAYGSSVGFYKKPTSIAAATAIAGIALASNVKLMGIWPNDGTTEDAVKGKEAFNLMIKGFIAVKVDDSVVLVTVAAKAAVAAASTDTSVVAGKTYYTRASSAAGIGLLNDGSYAYTAVASPTGNPSTSSYYELSVLGVNGTTNAVTPGKQAAVILATGGITTIDAVSSGTVEALPGYYFTGVIEGRLVELEIRR